MIRLPATSLPKEAQTQLSNWQGDIDALPDYAAQVVGAKRTWPLRNIKRNKTFANVRETLAGMCSGAQRCCYCEDSCADEVEHIRPKDLFPDQVFSWENYLYACGICNVEKRNNFAVFPDAGLTWVDIKRKPDAPVMPPTAGDPVIIDPRVEDPMQYLMLDLLGTFTFQPIPTKGTRERERAEYTIDVLGLNKRSPLVAARRNAYDGYRARLVEYVKCKAEEASEAELKTYMLSLQRCPHPSVWQEMKRQQHKLADLKNHFAAAPEAMHW